MILSSWARPPNGSEGVSDLERGERGLSEQGYRLQNRAGAEIRVLSFCGRALSRDSEREEEEGDHKSIADPGVLGYRQG